MRQYVGSRICMPGMACTAWHTCMSGSHDFSWFSSSRNTCAGAHQDFDLCLAQAQSTVFQQASHGKAMLISLLSAAASAGAVAPRGKVSRMSGRMAWAEPRQSRAAARLAERHA